FHVHCDSVRPSIAARNSLRESASHLRAFARSSAVICASAAAESGTHESSDRTIRRAHVRFIPAPVFEIGESPLQPFDVPEILRAPRRPLVLDQRLPAEKIHLQRAERSAFPLRPRL